jgi:hypothetical protein
VNKINTSSDLSFDLILELFAPPITSQLCYRSRNLGSQFASLVDSLSAANDNLRYLCRCGLAWVRSVYKRIINTLNLMISENSGVDLSTEYLIPCLLVAEVWKRSGIKYVLWDNFGRLVIWEMVSVMCSQLNRKAQAHLNDSRTKVISKVSDLYLRNTVRCHDRKSTQYMIFATPGWAPGYRMRTNISVSFTHRLVWLLHFGCISPILTLCGFSWPVLRRIWIRD